MTHSVFRRIAPVLPSLLEAAANTTTEESTVIGSALRSVSSHSLHEHEQSSKSAPDAPLDHELQSSTSPQRDRMPMERNAFLAATHAGFSARASIGDRHGALLPASARANGPAPQAGSGARGLHMLAAPSRRFSAMTTLHDRLRYIAQNTEELLNKLRDIAQHHPRKEEGWNAWLKDFDALDGRVFDDLSRREPGVIDSATRHRALDAAKFIDKFVMMKDCMPAIEHYAKTGRGIAPDELFEQLNLSMSDIPLPDDLKHAKLAEEEIKALSIYSVASPVMEEIRLNGDLHWMSRLFRIINHSMRTQDAVLMQVVEPIIQPVLSGAQKLNPRSGQALYRGLVIPGRDALDGYYKMFAQAQRSRRLVVEDGFMLGSCLHPYPGNLALKIITSSKDTNARDTSAFSYASQKEGVFLPRTSLQVLKTEWCEPNVPAPETFAFNDLVTESSGRSYGAFEKEPRLFVWLEEVPRDV